MDEWQRQHIQKNLVQLVKFIRCSPELITRLEKENVLHQDDVEELELPILTPSQKSKRLLEILMTRVGAYNHLMYSLHTTKQSGALKILKEHTELFRCFGSISYDKNYVLGTGSLGTKVFRGSYDGRDVAVKVLNTDIVDTESAIREVNTMKKIDSHENIVRYFMAESQDNFIYIALELCLISLQDEVKMSLINMDILTVLKQCTSGLAHLHRHNVIHGDLKPANILINQYNQIKLSDFGISKQTQSDKTSVSATCTGTLDWMAPEILIPLLGEKEETSIKMSTAADIFSLGCVFYFVLTKGSHPYGGKSECQNNIMHNQPQLTLELEVTWLNLISRMISFSKSDRPPTEDILLSISLISQQKYEVIDLVDLQNLPVSCNTVSTSQVFEPIKIVDTMDGNNAVFYGVMSGLPIDKLRQLIENKCDWKIRNKNGRTILHVAAEAGNLDAVRYFLSIGADIHAKDNSQETPLLNCSNSKKYFKEIANVLVTAGSDINAVSVYGNNLLLLSALRGRSRNELEEIINLGISWQYKNIFDETALHKAVEGGNLDAIKYFISLGADTNAKETLRGRAPLHFVGYIGEHFEEAVLLLIGNGAFINATDSRGRTVLDLLYHFKVHQRRIQFFRKLGGLSSKPVGV